ncbi:MAG: primosomal protein N' [Bdellovibrionales bacterium]|nr:primosomal protein N' [Bdellovibrionales bacterium]
MNPSFYVVAVDSPLKEALTYLPPEDGRVFERGQSVRVPLGSRKAYGVVMRQTQEAPPAVKLKAILEREDERPTIPEPYMDWLEWLAQYYVFPAGMIMETVFPPLGKESTRTSRKSPVVKDYETRSEPPPLTEEQRNVLRQLKEAPDFNVHLLFGVTGSGKTEVYMHLLEEVLARGKQGLVLVPEISLTPQLIDRFSKRFPGQVAVLHSHLTAREKTTQWWNMVDGKRKILIGARSALFCPLPDLDLIVLDEEHEPSYKQDEQLKYHARDAAIMLAKRLNIPIVLGSATPSLESWNNVQTGKYQLHEMTQRVNARAMPAIEVVDLRELHRQRKDTPSSLPFWLSDRLHEELVQIFDKKEQAALFLNRRGVAQTAQCHACGYVAECPNCSVSLTVHATSHLVCHYCDYSERLTEMCPDCKESPLEPLGLGTERVEKDMATLFPDIRIARADRDEVQSRDQLEKLVEDVETRNIDLLVGTQMIAKGLDFPHLNLVGLVLADVGFHWPDFRASERSFQLLTQVSGRSGRQSAGKVVIQTYDPEHASIRHTLGADFQGFAKAELEERSGLFYPPFWRMAMLRIQSNSKERGERTADLLVQRAHVLQRSFAAYGDGIHVLGPAEAPLFKLRNKFRYQVMLKCDSPARLNAFCRQLLADDSWIETGTKVQVDIDPFQML